MTTTEIKTETGTWKVDDRYGWHIIDPSGAERAAFADPLTMACHIAMLLDEIARMNALFDKTGNSSSEEKS